MHTKHSYLQLLRGLALCWAFQGCAGSADIEAPADLGVLCFNVSANEQFLEADTRASVPVTDLSSYDFLLNATPLTLNAQGQAIIKAGTYTLSATNSQKVDGGYAAPLHYGSTPITLVAGETLTVKLDLGKPKNAKVTLQSTSNFTSLYTLTKLTLSDASHTVTRNEQDLKDVFFPVAEGGTTQITYALSAKAKKGSHVQDITNVTGSFNIKGGHQTMLSLTADPINGFIQIEQGTEHNGEFQ